MKSKSQPCKHKATKTHLFIDTNVFLEFYRFSNGDIKQLKHLVDSVKSGGILIYIPDQVKKEFMRNREAVISNMLKDLKSFKFEARLPSFTRDQPDSKNLTDLLSQANSQLTKIIKDTESLATNHSLPADLVIQELFGDTKANRPSKPDDFEKILQKARLRKELGNPPGKQSDCIGDQLNWEFLLDTVPDGENLVLVTKDGDYASPLDKSMPSDSLKQEWKTKKGSEITLFNDLASFLQKNLSSVHLSAYKEKDALVQRFIKSTRFSETHEAIAELRLFTDLLTDTDITSIAEAFEQNSQIYRIRSDKDVLSYGFTILGLIKTRSLLSTEKQNSFLANLTGSFSE